jgi:hypothetical protein
MNDWIANDRELATVLAALRYWQNDLRDDAHMFVGLSGSGHFALVEPLTCEEIDTLCERLNAIGFAKHREEDPDCTCADCRTWNERWTLAK